MHPFSMVNNRHIQLCPIALCNKVPINTGGDRCPVGLRAGSRGWHLCGNVTYKIWACRMCLSYSEHHYIVFLASLHNRVSITATGLTCTSLLITAATYAPQHLRRLGRGLP